MKEIVAKPDIYLEEYDVHVKPYLSYAEIQAIVNSTMQFESWAERQQNIDMLMLAYGTDIGLEKLQEVGHEVLYNSGLIGEVRMVMINWADIYEGLEYEESIIKLLAQIVNKLPNDVGPVLRKMGEGVSGKKNNKNNK